MNDPELAFALNKIYNKSRLQCSSECLKHESCFYFDFCKIGSSSSCYIYNNNVTNTSAVESGACKRFGLKQTCDAEYTYPCRCPTNMGDERCNYNYDCSGNLVDKSTPSHKFYKTFSNNIGKEMWCEMNIDNGGWIVFQQRVDGSTNFYRGWTEYENGFGDISTNFYLGNYYLHEIVQSGDYELRIELEDQNGVLGYASYTNFIIGGPSTFYTLEVSGFFGNATDCLVYHNGMKFTTYDSDNDQHTTSNCAVSFIGAWWYNACHYSNLNGQYGTNDDRGIIWNFWRGSYHSMVKTKMMARKKMKHQY